MIQGKFVNLDAATLAQMQTDWLANLQSTAVVGQSYSIAGRSFTKVSPESASDMLAEISFALKAQGGGMRRTSVADMSTAS